MVEDHAEQGHLYEEQISGLEVEYAEIILKGMDYYFSLHSLVRKKRETETQCWQKPY